MTDHSSSSGIPTEPENSEGEQRIRERARRLWELEGKQEGGDEAYWHRAKELIEAEACSAYPPAQSRGHRS
jgi:DUF2934 family protein